MSMNINTQQAELLKNYYLEGNTKGTSAKEISELEAAIGKDKVKQLVATWEKEAAVDKNEYEIEDGDYTSYGTKGAKGSEETLPYGATRKKEEIVQLEDGTYIKRTTYYKKSDKNSLLEAMRTKRDNKLIGIGAGLALGAVGLLAAGAGPIGWVAMGVGALIAGIFAIGWFSDNSKIKEAEETQAEDEVVGVEEEPVENAVNSNSATVNVNQTVVVNINNDFSEIERILNEMNGHLGNIDQNVGDISAKLDRIETLLGNIESQLIAAGVKLDDIEGSLQNIDADLREVIRNQVRTYNLLKENLAELKVELKRGNALAAEILANIIKYGDQNNADNAQNNEDNATIISLLGQIKDKMHEMNLQQENNFALILQGIRNLEPHDYAAALQRILDAINANGDAILGRLDEQIAVTEEINGQLETTNMTLNEILNKIRSGEASLGEIKAYLQAIQNNTGSSAADLSMIRNMLGQVLEAEIQQNTILQNMDGQYAEILQRIYDKIPELINSDVNVNVEVKIDLLVNLLVQIFMDMDGGEQNYSEAEYEDEFSYIFS